MIWSGIALGIIMELNNVNNSCQIDFIYERGAPVDKILSDRNFNSY